MKTSTAEFEASHGRKPRGRGNWWFRVTATDGDGKYTTDERNAFGTLTEARAIVCRQMRSDIGVPIRFTEIEVMP